jgi:glutaconate CoA-transferase subunit B
MDKKEYAKDYTESELMASLAAKEIKNGDVVFVGIGVPMAAAVLAINLHAPDAIIVFESGYIGGKPIGAIAAVGDIGCGFRATSFTTMLSVFIDLQRGLFDLGMVGAAMIDKYGNINTTYIGGKYEQPKLRLPGSGGANDIMSSARRTLIVMKFEGRRFAEKLDYITSPGHLDGSGLREKLRLRGGGPVGVITTKCVLRFNEYKELYLDTIYPGVTIEEIKEEVPWLKVSPKLKIAEPPTREEIELLRTLDPTDVILQSKRIYASLDFWNWAEIVEKGWNLMLRENFK